MGFIYLQKRGMYYFRVRIPTDLRQHFDRLELRRSLHTGDYRKARSRVKIEAARAEITFERMRCDTLTKDQLRKIADDYLHSTLKYCEEVRGSGATLSTHEMRDSNHMVLGDQFDRYSEALSDLDVEETRGRGLKLAEKLVTPMMTELNLFSLPKDSEDYAFITRELLKGAMEVCRIEGERTEGNYSNEYDRGRLYRQGGVQD